MIGTMEGAASFLRAASVVAILAAVAASRAHAAPEHPPLPHAEEAAVRALAGSIEAAITAGDSAGLLALMDARGTFTPPDAFIPLEELGERLRRPGDHFHRLVFDSSKGTKRAATGNSYREFFDAERDVVVVVRGHLRRNGEATAVIEWRAGRGEGRRGPRLRVWRSVAGPWRIYQL